MRSLHLRIPLYRRCWNRFCARRHGKGGAMPITTTAQPAIRYYTEEKCNNITATRLRRLAHNPLRGYRHVRRHCKWSRRPATYAISRRRQV